MIKLQPLARLRALLRRGNALIHGDYWFPHVPLALAMAADRERLWRSVRNRSALSGSDPGFNDPSGRRFARALVGSGTHRGATLREDAALERAAQ